jgi:hypothetical protein
LLLYVLKGELAVVSTNKICGQSLSSKFLFHSYVEEEKSMIHSFTVTFGAKYLTGMVTSVPPYEAFGLIKMIFFISLKTTKITLKSQISEVVVSTNKICGQSLSSKFLLI